MRNMMLTLGSVLLLAAVSEGRREPRPAAPKVFRHSHQTASGRGGRNGRAYGAVVPLPQIIHPRGHPPATLSLSPGAFKLKSSLSGCDVMDAALARYPAIIFPATPTAPSRVPKRFRAQAAVTELAIRVQGPCPRFPDLRMVENYTLDVHENGSAVLSAPSVWGALRGLETFSQLVFSPAQGTYRLRSVAVADWARFPHRGLLLDSSRHFLPVPVLLDTLELMAENKLNVFHWHVTDDPSFPFASQLFPGLARKGGFGAEAGGAGPAGHVYSLADVRTIVEAARLRGIRVLPEFDTPGHTASWGLGMEKLLTECFKDGKATGKRKGLDVSNSELWSFLSAFFGEVMSLFPDAFVHLGGDEVYAYKDCWMSNPQMANLRKAANLTTWQDVEGYYFKNFIALLTKLRSDVKVMAWNEVFDHGDAGFTPANSVIQIWNGAYEDKMREVTARGFPAVLSACWYLDRVTRNTSWESYYECDPLSFKPSSPAQAALVLGGEACLWGEFVDSTNLGPRLWPRASVVAERLWSSADEQNIHQAGLRFDEHRCRLIARGHAAEPLTGPGYCPTEWTPPTTTAH